MPLVLYISNVCRHCRYISGVNHTVALLEPAAAPFCVFCTLDRSMIVQRRVAPFRLGFNRTWHEYKTGFGNPTGEFWVGLENIHSIVSHPSQYALSLQVSAYMHTCAHVCIHAYMCTCSHGSGRYIWPKAWTFVNIRGISIVTSNVELPHYSDITVCYNCCKLSPRGSVRRTTKHP